MGLGASGEIRVRAKEGYGEFCFCFRMNSTVLRAKKAMDSESKQTRKDRVAVVEA